MANYTVRRIVKIIDLRYRSLVKTENMWVFFHMLIPGFQACFFMLENSPIDLMEVQIGMDWLVPFVLTLSA